MSKAQWKQPALKQAEKKVVDREQAIQEAKFWKEQVEALKKRALELDGKYLKAKSMADMYRGKAGAYDFLRRQGVVLMGDEPKHLQGDDMDKYIERHTWNSLDGTAAGNRALRQMMDSARIVNYPSFMAAETFADEIDKQLTFKATGRYNIGSNTGSESKEADQKDSGHYTDILRYADWYRVWKQRSS